MTRIVGGVLYWSVVTVVSMWLMRGLSGCTPRSPYTPVVVTVPTPTRTIDLTHCDVNCDGKCTLADSVIILRASLSPPTATIRCCK